MKNTIIVKPRTISDLSSYWAMFYCAVLKTICFQKNLKFNFHNVSLRDYRGQLSNPANFFNHMRGAVKNHGFEYLMIDYLRSMDGIEVTKLLLDRLLEKRGIKDFDFQYFNIFKVGEDSKFQEIIDKYENPDVKIFVPEQNYKTFKGKNNSAFTYSSDRIGKTFINSDLLILISDGKRYSYGFVGEIEGQHGENLYRNTYWGGVKAMYSTFAIGASDRKKPIEKIELKNNIVITESLNGIEILNFSNANQFVKDFKNTIDNIELCLNGHYSNVSFSDESHKQIFSLIERNWSAPLVDLIAQFERFIVYVYDSSERYVQNFEESEGLTFKPSIAASVTQFPFYRFPR